MNTPLRAFRISDDLYSAVLAEAEATGETASDIVRRALTTYCNRKKR